MAALRPASVLRRTRNARIHPFQRLAKQWQSTGHSPKPPGSVNFETLINQMEQEYPDPKMKKNIPSFATKKRKITPGLLDIDDIDQSEEAVPRKHQSVRPPRPRPATTSHVKPSSTSPKWIKPPSTTSQQRIKPPSTTPQKWIKPQTTSSANQIRPPIVTSSNQINLEKEAPGLASSTGQMPQSTRHPRPAITPHKRLQEDRTTTIRFNKRDRVFDNIFLRDSCTCPRCVDVSTRQKLFDTPDIPASIRVKHLVQEKDHVSITWQNDVFGYDSGHVTRLPNAFLTQAYTGPHARSYTMNKRMWSADVLQDKEIDFDYQEYMSSDDTLHLAVRRLNASGIIFIKNVPELESSVMTTANRIGPLKNTFYGSTWDVRSVSNAKNVAYTDIHLGFHMDLLYMQQPPRLQLLHCLRASTHGGVSLFSDSYRAAWNLFQNDRSAFDILAQNPVNFHYDNDSHMYHQTRRVFELKSEVPANVNKYDFVTYLNAVNWAPPFQGPFHGINRSDINLSLKVREWHEAAQKFRDLTEAGSAVYKRQMVPGELVMFDNRRVLHARTAFHGGERWLRGAYLDDDPFLSKLRVLARDQSLKETSAGHEDNADNESSIVVEI